MATLVLGVAGAAVGGAIGGTILGVSAAAIGFAVGATVGSAIDQRLLAPNARIDQEGPRLKTVDITSSTEGSPIPRVAGRTRLSGQIIWATRFEEEVRTESQSQSAGKGSGPKVTTTTTTYRYFANFAVALCEGPVARIGRIWADGKEVDQTEVTVRTYRGTEDQGPDSLIEAKEGEGNAPAYRGVAYVVFDRLPIDEYGRRIPQITVEVWRSLGDLEPRIKGVALIPGATEFGYDPSRVLRMGTAPGGAFAAPGGWVADNRHTKEADTNWVASLDLLDALAPNVETVLLVVTWFGDDLRCGECQITPKVELHAKQTHKPAGPGGIFDEAAIAPEIVAGLGLLSPTFASNTEWFVAGLTRNGTFDEEEEEVVFPAAEAVSLVDNRPAYGGTPNDASVVAAIQDLKARGLKVIYCPFIMMDIPSANDLPNPYSDNAAETGQPPHPWRGRITVSPAPGFDGSPDKTGAAAAQVSAFVGDAEASDFAVEADDIFGAGVPRIVFNGTPQWSYSRFILHHAKLCQLAGGVDGFLIGSEMIGMTTARDGATSYPFVDALKSLAGEVRTILGSGTDIGYGADWSEYHSHRPGDGSGDVIFHLDPLWADANIDFIGIDNYLPLSDWRDGTGHADWQATGPASIYDPDYLKANIEGGEYYDWFYPAAGATGNEPSAERIAQTRTPIVDSAHQEHWVFRNKDIRNWWLNAHHNRPGGVREGSSTDWVPQSKPVVFTEFGCPAVDKGTNQPNVFFDPKSSESFLPYFSSGARDDAIQRAYLEATIDYWLDPANNPTSSVYSGRMIDMDRSCVWAWDARMVPSFPQDHGAWADGPNWETGHWISGRLGAAPADETIRDIFERAGFADFDIAPLGSVVDAVIADRVLSPRQMVEALAPVHLIMAAESGGTIRVRSRRDAATGLTIDMDALLDPGGSGGGPAPAEPFRKTRAQETDLPAEIHLTYGEPTSDDQPGGVTAIRQVVGSRRVVEMQAPAVMAADKAQAAAEAMLFDAWHGRERLAFGLPPSLLALEPGDVVTFAHDGDHYRIDAIAEGLGRRLELGRMDAGLLVPAATPRRRRASSRPAEPGPPGAVFFDGPLIADHLNPFAPLLGAVANPWSGGVGFWTSPGETGFQLDTIAAAPVKVGQLAFDLWSGPTSRWDNGNEIWVDMAHGAPTSADPLAVFNGANAIAVMNAPNPGEWEIIQFRDAELVEPGRYRLTRLLRGQRGTEFAMRDPVEAGALVVVLDEALVPARLGAEHLGLALNWRVGPATHPVTDATFVEGQFTHHAKALRPYAPVHVQGRRPAGTEDIRLTWIRRTRIGGDSWNAVEVPLGEDSEAYDIEILDGETVVRELTAAEPSVTYNAAQQTADWGAPLWIGDGPLSVRIYQRSETFGRGIPGTAELTFPLRVVPE